MGKYFKKAMLPILVALISASALSSVSSLLHDDIERNKKIFRKEAIEELYAELKIEYSEISDEKALKVKDKSGKPFDILYYNVNRKDGKTDFAFALPGKELAVKGFSGPINALIATDKELTVMRGIMVLDHKETPGLGDKINKRHSFRKYFEELNIKPMPEVMIKTVKSKNTNKEKLEIHAITGATISSKAVAFLVNQGLKKIKNNKSKLK